MRENLQFYIDGAWVDPIASKKREIINPATEQVCGHISLGGQADVDRAAKAAHKAFDAYSQFSREQRLDLFKNIIAAYSDRQEDLAKAVTEEMGAPASLAQRAQAAIGLGHFMTALKILETYSFEQWRGSTQIVKEPIGVCGLITPWNWPLNQIACKVAPALATGCGIVLKPSEVAPFSAYIFAEIMAAAGVPKGVFNMVNGEGAVVGAAISSHPLIDLVSFTGSTRAGIEVARNAAPTVKRVHQELGGKSPNIILDGPGFDKAVAAGVKAVMINSGQSCNAPTRMLVPHSRMEEALHIARATVDKISIGDPTTDVQMGPVASEAQWSKIQKLIQRGVDEGAKLVAGGTGKPEGLTAGYYVRPTIFGDVRNDMTIAREEIFGPVLAILGFETIEEAVTIANDTEYGLAAYVYGPHEEALKIASKLRAGQVTLNNAPADLMAPFGGYKMSGNGREWGDLAFDDFLEIKAVLGAGAR